MSTTHHAFTEMDLRPTSAGRHEMPGLKLTARQASRFWSVDAAQSERLLEALVEAGAMLRTSDGAYVLFNISSTRR